MILALTIIIAITITIIMLNVFFLAPQYDIESTAMAVFAEKNMSETKINTVSLQQDLQIGKIQ